MSDIEQLLTNKKRGYVMFEANATRLAKRSVLTEVTKVSATFKPLKTVEHILEAGHHVDVCHAMNDVRFVNTFINGRLVTGEIHKKHFTSL